MASPSGDLIKVGDLEINRVSHQVIRDNHPIELTPKEYSLLEYLASHPDQVVSRTMILENVWDASFGGLTTLVDVYVRHLQGKIDEPFPLKLIHTVRGSGYKLSAHSSL